MTESVTYTTRTTSLGLLLVAATGRGVCQVRFGTSEAGLAAALARELPCATLSAGAHAWRAGRMRWLPRQRAAATSRACRSTSRAAASSTACGTRCGASPRGATRGYGELAEALGQPRAARAVAQACAANPVPLAVPCHRVVPKAGGAGGYRFGGWRKRALLAAEAAPRSS